MVVEAMELNYQQRHDCNKQARKCEFISCACKHDCKYYVTTPITMHENLNISTRVVRKGRS
jgi:hypothetical protein